VSRDMASDFDYLAERFRGRIREMRENAAEVTRELGLPAEAEGTVLRTLYGEHHDMLGAATETISPSDAANASVLAKIAVLIKKTVEGIAILDPIPVRLAFDSPMLGSGQSATSSAPPGSGSFRLPLVLVPGETGNQRVRVIGQTVPGVDGIRVEVRLMRYQARGGDVPLEGYGVILLDPVMGEPIRIAPTDSTGTVSFTEIPADAIRQYARLVILTPALLSTLPRSNE